MLLKIESDHKNLRLLQNILLARLSCNQFVEPHTATGGNSAPNYFTVVSETS